MRIEPTLEEVIHGERGMLKGITACIEAKCLVSSLALMFATIDAVAALGRPIKKLSTDRHVFADWADRYLDPQNNLGCSAVDLYAARCGVLHEYVTASDLARRGDAKLLIYEWKSGPAADASIPIPKGAIVIQVEALHQALLAGIMHFEEDAETKQEVTERVKKHLPALLCYAPSSPTRLTAMALSA